jgi:hypothetical protein
MVAHKVIVNSGIGSHTPCLSLDPASVLWIGIALMPIWIRNRLPNLMAIQIRILPQALHMLENHKYFTFIHDSAGLHCLIFLTDV